MIDRFKAACARAWARVKGWWKATVIAILAAVAPWFGLMIAAQDASVTVSWENATTYENGDPLPESEIQETRLYRADYPVGGADGSQAKSLVATAPATVTTYVDESLPSGTFCYHATHVATNGGESGPSNEACFTIDQRSPGAPQNLTAQ